MEEGHDQWSFRLREIAICTLLLYINHSLCGSLSPAAQKHTEDSPKISCFLHSLLLFCHSLLKVTFSAKILVKKKGKEKLNENVRGNFVQ